MSRLTLALGLALLAIEVSVAVAIISTSESNEASWWTNGLALLAGVAFVVSGLVAITRRPDNRTGVYLAAVGYAWFLGALTDSGNPWVAAVGNVFGSLSFAAFAALLLTFPTGRFRSRFERAFPIVVGATFIGITLVQSLVDPTPFADCPRCADNPLDVVDWSGAASTLEVLTDLAGIVLGLTGVVLIVRRWRGAAPAMRRVLWPVLATGGFALGVLVVFGVVYAVTGSEIDRLGPVFLASFAAVPIAFLAGILRTRLARASVSELVVALEAGEPLRDALADTLNDDGLTVLYWLDELQGTQRGGWVDPEGHAAADPVSTPERSVKFVEEDGRRIAAITYDAALDAGPELLDAVTATARMALRGDRLQAELRAEVEYISTVTDTVPSLLTSVDTDGRIRNVNRAAIEVAGHATREEVVGEYYWDVFIDPDEREAVVGRFNALAPTFPPGEYENTFVNARGEERVVYWRTAPIHDEDGTVFAIISGGVDITERRKRELELERERDVQSTVFESMPSIMVVLAPDGTIRDRDVDNPRVGANRAFQRFVRWPDDELVGRPFLDLVVEDDDGRAARAVATAAAGETSDEVESALRSADGTSRVFVWWAVPVADVTNRMERLVLVCGADITERKRLEADNERERAFLNAIANNAPSLLCLIDAEGVLTDRGANIAFEHTLEYEPDAIGGQVFWETFVAPEDRDEVQAVVRGVAAGEMPLERDHTWLTTSGRRLSMAWTCTPLPVIDERTLFLVTAVDITERKRIAEDLRASRARLVRAEEMARRTLERNLHDGAQQRLVALSVSLRLLQTRLQDDPGAALELLAGAQVELSQALEELRELARGIHPAVLTDRGLRPALETLAARAPIPVELVAPDERLPADVEAAAYYVVAESLTNIAKYANATSAHVHLERDAAEMLLVTVSDDGAGGADPANGSGLRGLADRVSVLDGTLSIESPPGRGTSIRAEIPIAD